jgi:hypothetical protein
LVDEYDIVFTYFYILSFFSPVTESTNPADYGLGYYVIYINQKKFSARHKTHDTIISIIRLAIIIDHLLNLPMVLVIYLLLILLKEKLILIMRLL